MGQIDDSVRSNLIIDKDTQLVYDVRKDMDMAKLDRQTSTKNGNVSRDISGISSPRLGSEASTYTQAQIAAQNETTTTGR